MAMHLSSLGCLAWSPAGDDKLLISGVLFSLQPRLAQGRYLFKSWWQPRPTRRSAGCVSHDSQVSSALCKWGRMWGHEGPRWGWGRCAPSSMLLLIQLLSAAPFGLLGEETRQVRG